MESTDWLQLAQVYIHSTSEHIFHAHFGLPVDAVTLLWHWILSCHLQKGYSVVHLLWTLYFLKTSPSSWEVVCSFFSVKEPRTFKKWLWETLCLIDYVLPNVCSSFYEKINILFSFII
jgi:hypothetical protein